jgi:citrate lyase subunit beta/citryl-CoA lyase
MSAFRSDFAARSLLFAPADSERKLDKALASAADLLLLDLEDSVAEPNKAAARRLVVVRLTRAKRRQALWVRINPLQTPHALQDLAAIVAARPDGVMLPKANGPSDVVALDHFLSALEVAAGAPMGEIKVMVVATETAQALFTTGAYAGAPRLAALTWGAEDLSAALGAADNRTSTGDYEFTYQLARSLCLAGACAAGVTPIETICADFRDLDGLKTTAQAARRAGFRGMMAIHPDQVAIINEAFTPSDAEVAAATRIVERFAEDPGAGVISIDGQMLDRPHLRRAEQILAASNAVWANR